MATLFDRVAVPVARAGTPGAWAGDWRLVAIDGVILDLADTPANLKVFPQAQGGTRRPFPQAKVVALAECGTHVCLAAGIGSIKDGEPQLARHVLQALKPGMLVLADRGFYSFDLWSEILQTGGDLAFRVKKDFRLPVRKILPDGSYLSEVHQPRIGKTRINADRVGDIRLATHIPVRVVEYTVQTGSPTSGETFRVITSVLAADRLPAVAGARQSRVLACEEDFLEVLVVPGTVSAGGGDVVSPAGS
jgi:hypothetical protein